MASVIKDADLKRLMTCVTQLLNEGCHSPIQVMKKVIEVEGCSLAEAKEAYLLVSNDETLDEYQARAIKPLIEELDEHER